ncbi:MAG: hypothetical protein DMD52_05820 [Gemmatimonadetes bacterium]|nr:MAG: hypothetical protein DMD52_05820 [Gemmatimonadota bacterium]
MHPVVRPSWGRRFSYRHPGCWIARAPQRLRVAGAPCGRYFHGSGGTVTVSEWQVWLVAALLLFVAEVLAPGFWLLSVAVGCVVAGAVSLVVPGVLAPALSFAAGTLLSLAGIRPFLLRRLHPPGREIKTNVDALVGRVGVVSERIDPATGRGRVVVEGEDWRGTSLMDTVIEPGTRVMVVRVEGTTLYVDKEG